jgi:hypothetical protein
MRKTLITVAMASTATLTACGSTSSAPAPSSATSSTSTATSTPTATTSPSTPSGNNAKLDMLVSMTNSQLKQVVKQFNGAYTSIVATSQPPATLILTYTFSAAIDPQVTSDKIAATSPELQKMCDQKFVPGMKSLDIRNPEARLIFLHPDGSKVYEYDCRS